MLFGVSTWLGFLGKPTEMGLAIAAGSLGFVFNNIDRIAKVKGPGFEAEMRERRVAESVIAEQTDNIEHLRNVFKVSNRFVPPKYYERPDSHGF